MDKVAREMCHFVVNMQARGVGSIYRIMKTPYQSWTYTPYMGSIYSQMPTRMLEETFNKLHDEHIDEFIELSQRKSLAFEKREQEKLERTLKGKRPLEEDIKMAMMCLPEIVRVEKDSDQGLVSVIGMRKIFKERMNIKLPHNRSYHIRDELLARLHRNDDALLKGTSRKEGGHSMIELYRTGS